MSDGKFRNKNVLITGAGSGFGRASALRFAHEGCAHALPRRYRGRSDIRGSG